MPKNDNLFNNFEEIQRKGVSVEIPKVMKSLKEPLEEFNRSQSVINDSVNALENTGVNNVNNMNNTNDMNDNAAGRGNSRVLKMGTMPETNYVPSNNNVNTNQLMNGNPNIRNSGPYYGSNSNASGGFMGGFTDTAILLAIAVLIALVFLVSSAIIMYLGLQ